MTVKQSVAWQALEAHLQKDIAPYSLKQLFNNAGARRFEDLSVATDGLLLDFSKQKLTPDTFSLLIDLAQQQGLGEATNALYSGGEVNRSEMRPALHTALRATPSDQSGDIQIDGQQVSQLVANNLLDMERIATKIQQGEWLGYSGQPITTVINIGVGGSDIGPHMVCHALDEFRVETKFPLEIMFVSSMDGSQLAEMLQHLDQASTLFIIASKTFTTIDTLANAETARAWLRKRIPSDSLIGQHHLVGCSAFPQRMAAWGIPVENQIALWDWVGGRYSLWSGIGLPIAIKLGMRGFKQLLKGAHAMDDHFQNAKPEQNLPVMLALTGIWNINFLGLKAHTLLPYDGRLKLLPNYLSQLEMESNGKSVTNTGESVDFDTSPVIWGDVGANAQHAFFQLLHQGTPAYYADFIVPIKRTASSEYTQATRTQLDYQQALNLANCVAQSRVLMLGDDVLAWDQSMVTSPDRLYPGNHASSTLMFDELTPENLGKLIALYEHKVFVQAVVWDINPFDQWGVELGKQIAKTTLSAIEKRQAGMVTAADVKFDASTEGLLNHVFRQQS
jgi:glucose-6-phosphate isomerase|tara:strand:+ start:3112 stop:4794 length:1683 start_codon:yes stop_codon:yes gene_type:complete